MELPSTCVGEFVRMTRFDFYYVWLENSVALNFVGFKIWFYSVIFMDYFIEVAYLACTHLDH